METPFAFMKFAAKAAAHALGSDRACDLVAEVGPVLIGDLRRGLGFPVTESPDASSQSTAATGESDSVARSIALLSEPEVRARLGQDLQAIAQAPPERLKEMIKHLVKEEAGAQTREVRQALATYLAKVPQKIRQSLRHDADPVGLTVPADFTIAGPDDLYRFLPEGLPGLERKAKAAATDDAATRITLTAVEGVHKGQSYSFAGHDMFLVGRAKEAHFQLPAADRFFSRIHFMVELNPPSCRLMDMGSRNGTHVNGQRVQNVELHDGDVIKAGKTVLHVEIKNLPVLKQAEKPTVTFVPPSPPTSAPPKPSQSGSTKPLICPVCQAAAAQGSVLCARCIESARNQPQTIAGYQIVRELGRGGMGVVAVAVRESDGAAVALKTINPVQVGNKGQVERFLREAGILQQLEHPNIVSFRDLGESGSQLFFAMDYVPGQDAAEIMKSEGPLTVARAVGWICQLLQALDYAHAKGFVHRDIKPGNLLIEPTTPREHVRLADFGLARVYQNSPISGLTLQGDIAGTFAYMAPEQITHFRESKPSADLYAASATLYHLLTGSFIFNLPKTTAERLLMILHEVPVPILDRRTDLPRSLADVIHQALHKDPAHRFADARAMLQALRPFAGG